MSHFAAAGVYGSDPLKGQTTYGSGKSKQINDEDASFEALKKYFFESPEERILDNWLRAHKISREDYNAMSPEQKDAIKREIADEVKKRAREKTENVVLGRL